MNITLYTNSVYNVHTAQHSEKTVLLEHDKNLHLLMDNDALIDSTSRKARLM